jgi:hypothetical protein
MESYPKPSYSNKQGKTTTTSPIPPKYRLPQRTIAVTHPNLYSALKKWQKVNMPQSQSQQSTQASIQSKTSNSVPSTLYIIDTPTSTMTPKRNQLWGSTLLQLPTTIGMSDLDPPSQELLDQRSKAVHDQAAAARLAVAKGKAKDRQEEEIKRLTENLNAEKETLTRLEAEVESALAKARSTKTIDKLDRVIAKQKLRPSIKKLKLWRHRQHGKTFVNGMNAFFNFRKWNTSDNQETKTAAGSQENSSRNLGKQTAAILYVFYDIPNWFSENELCTLLGYAFRNHNVRQAVYRMVERDMLICKQDTTDTEKYYLSELALEMAGRSPEDNPDIERTNPTYAESIEIRKKAGLTLINSRKQLKTPPANPANITPLTLADGVEDAKRKLAYKQNSKKRSKTTAATANSSDSHDSDESSSSDSSDSEDSDEETPDSDSDDTPKENNDKNNDAGFMDEDEFDQILPAAKNKGTDFNNVAYV